MNREFLCLVDIYSKPNKDKVQKLLKKDIVYKRVFDTDQIKVEEFIDDKGKIVKDKCAIRYDEEYIVIKEPYDQIKSLITPLVIKGFVYNKKK